MEDKNLPTPADVYAYEESPPEGYVARQVPGVLGSMMTVYVNPQDPLDRWVDPQTVAQQKASMDMRDDADQLFNSILFPTGAGTFYGASNIAEGNFSEGALQLASALPLPFLKAFKVKTPKQVPNFVNNNVVNTNVWDNTLERELDIVRQKLLDLYKNKASAEELQNVSDELTKLINIKNSDPRFKVVPQKQYSNSVKDLTRSVEPDSYNAIRFEGEPIRQGQLYDVWKDDYPNLINWKELGLKDASLSLDDFFKFRAEDYDRRDELLNYIIGPRQNKYGGSSKYQDGGSSDYNNIPQSWKDTYDWTPNVEAEYQAFKNDPMGPSNLAGTDDMNDYNTRGMWDSLDRPADWKQGLDLYKQQWGEEWTPEEDGYYHAWSQHPGTGEWLKPKHHNTAWMNYNSYIYDPNNMAVVNPEGFFGNETLQSYPKKVKYPDGGGVFNNSIDKKHNLKTSAEGYYAYINGVTLSKGGSPKSWLDKYK
jgi:hypothetical protein